VIASVLRAAGRAALAFLVNMQYSGFVIPDDYEASTDQACPETRDRRLSAAERRAWADLEQRLR